MRITEVIGLPSPEIEFAVANQLRTDAETSPIAWAPYLAVSGIGLFIKSPRQTAKQMYQELKQLCAPNEDNEPERSPRSGWIDASL